VNYKRVAIRVLVILFLTAVAVFTFVVKSLNHTFDQWNKGMANPRPDVFAIMTAARPRAAVLNEYLAIFTNGAVTYTIADSNGWSYLASAGLYNRYELNLHLATEWDASGSNITGFLAPRFYLYEVESVVTNEGQLHTSYDPSGALKFGSNEWQKLRDSRGDFLALGYKMKTNKPVAGFATRRSVTDTKRAASAADKRGGRL
jgi:hypothetical protein